MIISKCYVVDTDGILKCCFMGTYKDIVSFGNTRSEVVANLTGQLACRNN